MRQARSSAALRGWLSLLALPVAAAVVVSACSQATRYRVLSFMFDGVPQPGAEAPRDEVKETSAGGPKDARVAARPAAPKPMFNDHAPYRDGRCGTCHNPDSGQLSRTAQEGLCQSCHANLSGEAKYVHGPVAVNACLFCHHYHRSVNRTLLLDDAKALCLRCHKREELGNGRHHATIEEQSCTECHDPHGGNNGFFLKRMERWRESTDRPTVP